MSSFHSGTHQPITRDLERLALGLAIRRLREARALSVVQTAASVGMETAMLNAIEQGEVDARWGTVMALLRSLDATVADLASELN
jgi:transcriptional regulator with XRE-family HTH domain